MVLPHLVLWKFLETRRTEIELIAEPVTLCSSRSLAVYLYSYMRVLCQERDSFLRDPQVSTSKSMVFLNFWLRISCKFCWSMGEGVLLNLIAHLSIVPPRTSLHVCLCGCTYHPARSTPVNQ